MLDPCRMLSAHGYRVTVLPVDGEGRHRPRRSGLGVRARHAARVGHARQQRDRHGARHRGRSPRCAASAACCVTPMRRRRSASCPSTSARWTSISRRSRRTRCTGRKAPAALFVRRSLHAAAAVRGRRPRARPAQRHAQRARHRRPGEALTLAVAEMPQDVAHTRRLRDRLWTALREAVPGGAPHRRRSRPRPRPPPAEQPARHARRRRRRPHRAGPRGRRVLDAIGVHQRRQRRRRTCSKRSAVPKAAPRCASASADSPPADDIARIAAGLLESTRA